LTPRQREIAVNLGLAVSFAYFTLLLSQHSAVTSDHLKSAWFLGGISVALLWVPILVFRSRLIRDSSAMMVVLAFAPLSVEVVYLGALLAMAG